MNLGEAIEDFDQLLPTDWRIASVVREGVIWKVVVRHQLTGEERIASALSVDAAAATVVASLEVEA